MVMTSIKSNAIKRADVFNPYTGNSIGTVAIATDSMVEDAVEKCRIGAKLSRSLSRAERAKILLSAAQNISENIEKFSQCIVSESGKTISQARKEVDRCINTLTLSAEEAKRVRGDIIPFDSFSGSENRQGYYRREPLGIIAGITPYNDPLNLAAHKIGPAIASGNAIIIKPAMEAPFSAKLLIDTIIEAGFPNEGLILLTGDAQTGKALVSSPHVRMISFTGGTKTAEKITQSAGLKKMSMDLGGNAPVIVMSDCDLDQAVSLSVSGAFWAAGQNCIGTQRIFVQEKIYKRYLKLFIEQTNALVCGDPTNLATDVGPMINVNMAIRAEKLVKDAVKAGASLETGGRREESLFHPTILTNAPDQCEVRCQEAFAPIVLIDKIQSLEEAIELANTPETMLHAGIFTNNLETAFRAIDNIEAAGIIINDSSDYRFDAMPFGGFKYGSMGREGVKFAINEMTQTKVVCFNRPTGGN